VLKSLLSLFFGLTLVQTSWSQETKMQCSLPLKPPKFPPAWTDSIRISLREEQGMISDHRHFHKGKPFVAVLTGVWVKNKDYTVEVMFLGKNDHPTEIWTQKLRWNGEKTKVELSALKLEQKFP
jgi:hypothetical protein